MSLDGLFWRRLMWNKSLEVKRRFQPSNIVLLSTEFGAGVKCFNCLQRGKVYYYGHGALLQVSREIPCRHFCLRNFTEQRHVEWATWGKTTVSAAQNRLTFHRIWRWRSNVSIVCRGAKVYICGSIWGTMNGVQPILGIGDANLITRLQRFDMILRIPDMYLLCSIHEESLHPSWSSAAGHSIPECHFGLQKLTTRSEAWEWTGYRCKSMLTYLCNSQLWSSICTCTVGVTVLV